MTPAHPHAALFAAFRDVTRPAMLHAGFGYSSCVAGTRIVLDVCSALGINAKPLPVRMQVSNADYVALTSPEAVAAAVSAGDHDADSQGGPWCIDVNSPALEPGHGGAGHVIAALTDTTGVTLVDIAADQAHRPHKSIHITGPLIALGADPAMMSTVGAETVIINPDDGHVVRYTRVTSRVYTTSPNWMRRSSTIPTSVFRRITADTIHAARHR